jgi:hypothetical protein
VLAPGLAGAATRWSSGPVPQLEPRSLARGATEQSAQDLSENCPHAQIYACAARRPMSVVRAPELRGPLRVYAAGASGLATRSPGHASAKSRASHEPVVGALRRSCSAGESKSMADVQATTDMDLAATVASPIQAEREQRMPLGFIIFGGLALAVQVLWLGLIGWCLLNLF